MASVKELTLGEEKVDAKDKTVILSFDPSHSTGYCLLVVDNTSKTGVVTNYGLIEIDIKGDFHGDAYLKLFTESEALITQYNPDVVTVEEYFFTGGGGIKSRAMVAGANLNPSYRAVIQMAARKHEKPYVMVNVSTWKSTVAGRARPHDIQIETWGKEHAKKWYIRQALWQRYQIAFPYMMRGESNRLVQFRDDIVDAVSMALCVAQKDYGVETFSIADSLVPENMSKPNTKRARSKYSDFDYETLPVIPDKKRKRKSS